jgi:cell cycle sensor histidine kinase DivJ
MMRSRLRFVHASWIALSSSAALAGGLAGGEWRAMILLAGIAAIPGLAGAFLPAGQLWGRGIIVIVWTLTALAGLILTGGGLSPLILLLALPALAALLAGAREMAAEAAVFAAIALFAVLLAGAGGWLPPPLEVIGAASAPLGFAGLVVAALAIWFISTDRTALPAETAAPAGEAAAPRAALSLVPALPDGCGAALVDLAPEGRIRAVTGDSFGQNGMVPGASLIRIAAPGAWINAVMTGRALVNAPASLADGRPVRISSRAHDEGTYLLILDAPPALDADAAQAEAQAQLKARTAYFASLGHDLKTPLNAILGYAEMMQAEVRGPMPEAYAEYPAIIHESGLDLLLLVDDILDLARAESGNPRLEPEPVDLTASAEAVIRQMTAQADRAGIRLRLKSPGEIWAEADARAVRQIWQNLVSNAIKYSSGGQTVSLETGYDAGAAILRVRDRGAGISAADIPRLTQPFAQGTGAKPGTGLGLSVVRRFAELHGGEIRIDSRPGRGTAVTVTLPRANETDLLPLEEAAE